MNEFYTILMLIVETPWMASRIGLMIASAMIIGFVIVENYSYLIKVIIAVTVFVIFEEWMRYTLIQSLAPIIHPSVIARYVTILAIILFLFGLVTGAIFGIRARQRERKKLKAAESVIYELENGGIQKTT
ncbi:MAG: hypothetical protein ACW99G_10330 [Candidatus Thorarchaeota archaeon]|jgi:type III secretory pathway component EscS